MDVEIRSSGIDRLGVFALRSFKVREVVLRWDTSHRVPATQVAEHKGRPDLHLHPDHTGSFFVVQSPECYVNHSCAHNTEVKDFMDVAVRDIAEGEEITSNYEMDGAGLSFACHCGVPGCHGMIGAPKG
ncbi:MAG TPA: SET domain-containing protein-lysine N-methyltransferase [Gammaproteobacteria bacterium]|jgi:SET domain-containing protein